MLRRLYKDLRHYLRFYRHHSLYELRWANIYFSGFGEDAWLATYFQGKRCGFYVDVGAFHPICGSNTYLFYRSGWHGINIEPNAQKLHLFQKYRPRDVTLPIAISAAEGSASFAVDEEVSGLVQEDYLHHCRLTHTNQVLVRTRPLRVVLDEHMTSTQQIDVLSVDCEGHDEVVLRSNDWVRFRPTLVLAEAFDEARASRIKEFLGGNRYRQVALCGLTLIFEDLDRANKLQ
jgi:FkbM family methyltransferase